MSNAATIVRLVKETVRREAIVTSSFQTMRLTTDPGTGPLEARPGGAQAPSRVQKGEILPDGLGEGSTIMTYRPGGNMGNVTYLSRSPYMEGPES